MLRQCCACLDPSSHLHGGLPRLQLSMAVTTETFDKPRLAQEEMRLADGPLESERLLRRRQQQIVFHLFAASRHCESRHSCISSRKEVQSYCKRDTSCVCCISTLRETRRPSRGERRPWLLRETRRGERRGDRGFLNESSRAWDDAAKSAKRIHLKVIMAGVENTTKSVRTLSAKLMMHDTDTILVLVLKSGNIHDTKETCARTVSYA